MSETLEQKTEGIHSIDPLCVRDMYIEEEFRTMEDYNWMILDPVYSSRTHTLAIIEGLAEAGALSTAIDFDNKLESLGKAYYDLIVSSKNDDARLLEAKMRAIQDVYECMRFFWDDEGTYDLGALNTVQRLTNRPLWSPSWKFKNQIKPPHQFTPEYGRLNQMYQRLEVGSIVEVSGRWAGNGSNPYKGETGEVLGFTLEPQAQVDASYLTVTFIDKNDWLHQRWLYTLDLLA